MQIYLYIIFIICSFAGIYAFLRSTIKNNIADSKLIDTGRDQSNEAISTSTYTAVCSSEMLCAENSDSLTMFTKPLALSSVEVSSGATVNSDGSAHSQKTSLLNKAKKRWLVSWVVLLLFYTLPVLYAFFMQGDFSEISIFWLIQFICCRRGVLGSLNYYVVYKKNASEWLFLTLIFIPGGELINIAEAGWDYLGDGTLTFLLRLTFIGVTTYYFITSLLLYKAYKKNKSVAK